MTNHTHKVINGFEDGHGNIVDDYDVLEFGEFMGVDL